MKKILLLLSVALLLAGNITAQGNFEGRIVYGIKVLGENADQMAPFMPESYEYTISGTKLKFKMEGGMTAAMMGEFLVDGESGDSYMVKHDDQIAYKMPKDEEDADLGEKPEIVKQDEVITILGHKCQKYVVKVKGDKNEMSEQAMWVTKDLKIMRPSKNMKNGGNVFVDGIEGFPLKIQTSTMGMTMVMTVTEIAKESVPKSEMSVPAGYEIKDFDPATFMGGGR